MELALNKNEQMLLDLLLKIPPEYDRAVCHIRETDMTREDITKVAIRYTDECIFDVRDYLDKHMEKSEDIRYASVPQDGFPGLHSSYIIKVFGILLEHGLDPNAVFKTEWGNHNLMSAISSIDNGYLGVDALALLLEHGGDPNLSIDGETLLDDIAFDIWFGSVEQEVRWLYDIWVHRWMVLVSCGGKCSTHSERLKPFKGYDEDGNYGKVFDISQLRDHRNFYYGLSFEDGSRTLHIYDRKSLWKVVEWR